MKNITIVHADSGQYDDVTIMPGTTSRDILDEIGLGKTYILTPGRGREALGHDENLYEVVPEGAKLLATTPQTVGSSGSLISHSSDSGVTKFLFRDNEETKIVSRCDQGAARRIIRPKERRIVKRREVPYWKERGWEHTKKIYKGYYRTRCGSFQGEAKEKHFGKLKFFICDPPAVVQNIHEWSCFNERSNGWYFVHINGETKDVSAGIIAIEQILTKAYKNETNGKREKFFVLFS